MRRLLPGPLLAVFALICALASSERHGEAATPGPATSYGFDISFPQCGSSPPERAIDFVVIGVNGGKAMTQNPCFGAQLLWARRRAAPAAYLNTNAPPPGYQDVSCRAGDAWCNSYYYGRDAAYYALAYASTAGPDLLMYWLDVETGNSWTGDTTANARVIAGMIDTLKLAGKQVGIYSTSLQYGRIAGAFAPKLPLWAPIPGTTRETLRTVCESAPAFGGGTIVMVQVTSTIDENFTCPPKNLPYAVTVPSIVAEGGR